MAIKCVPPSPRVAKRAPVSRPDPSKNCPLSREDCQGVPRQLFPPVLLVFPPHITTRYDLICSSSMTPRSKCNWHNLNLSSLLLRVRIPAFSTMYSQKETIPLPLHFCQVRDIFANPHLLIGVPGAKRAGPAIIAVWGILCEIRVRAGVQIGSVSVSGCYDPCHTLWQCSLERQWRGE